MDGNWKELLLSSQLLRMKSSVFLKLLKQRKTQMQKCTKGDFVAIYNFMN